MAGKGLGMATRVTASQNPRRGRTAWIDRAGAAVDWRHRGRSDKMVWPQVQFPKEVFALPISGPSGHSTQAAGARAEGAVK
jgi:hypothetical protein